MVNFYKKLDKDHKGLFILAVIDIVIFILLLPLGFLHEDSGFKWLSVSMGWLLGSVAQLIAYGSIIFFSSIILNPNIKSNALKAVAPLTFFLRFALYIIVLAVSAICTFKKDIFGGFDLFNFWSCAVPLVFLSFYTMGAKLIELKNVGAAPVEDKKEEK